MSTLTLLSARYTYALKSLNLIFSAVRRHLRPSPKIMHVGQANDHLARDIGLTQAEIERHRFTLPSQDTHHPYG